MPHPTTPVRTRPTRPGTIRAWLLLVALPLAFQAVAATDVVAQDGAAQEDAELAWTPEFSMQFRDIGGTAISPDGEKVAFTVREPLMEGEQSEYRTHVWVAAADGSCATSPSSPTTVSTSCSPHPGAARPRSGPFPWPGVRPSR